MKYLFVFVFLYVFSLATNAQNHSAGYDQALADSLGADANGMKPYIFVLLKTGPNTTQDKEKISQAFKGHMENITRLVEQHKLIVAGPFKKNEKGFRGLFILNRVKTIAEAQELLQTDPAVKEKLLEAEVFEWYGSAALPLYLKANDRITKKKP
ncbi:MAG: YciI family protein [Rufibacter sp.]